MTWRVGQRIRAVTSWSCWCLQGDLGTLTGIGHGVVYVRWDQDSRYRKSSHTIEPAVPSEHLQPLGCGQREIPMLQPADDRATIFAPTAAPADDGDH
jgi:hypothetical protein